MVCQLPNVIIIYCYKMENYKKKAILYKRIICEVCNIIIYLILITYGLKK